jgi:hypothetical protein
MLAPASSQMPPGRRNENERMPLRRWPARLGAEPDRRGRWLPVLRLGAGFVFTVMLPARSDLERHRQDHRAATSLLVEEALQGVVHTLIEVGSFSCVFSPLQRLDYDIFGPFHK